VRLLLRDRYPVAEQIARVPAPTTVVYGTRDSLVPPDQSRRVAAAAQFPARMVAVEGADHNDRVFLDGGPLIRATVDLARRSG
jgi:pimeloyl-ACP methyl ester carboxylesterase